MQRGQFIVSLDFELMWGVRDTMSIEDYGDAVIGGRTAVERMLISFEEHRVKATFAIVGFLFCKNKRNLIENIPSIIPAYHAEELSPYVNIENYLGKDESEDPYHFGYSLVQLIKDKNSHEIATHTFCHYYCLENGQNILQFEADLKAAINVSKENGIEIKSIIFPRNQYNEEYLNICYKYGITSFRGNEKSKIYEPSNGENQTLTKRARRLLDSYINITGHNCHNLNEIKKSIPYNIPSSSFLRPYNKTLHFLEKLKLLRIKRAMTYAAKNNLLYHLWWHPHNFGRNLDKNFEMLHEILDHYNFLNERYQFESVTMEELSNRLNIN
jgi:peptidoglycan/xylan/chitin deacetylase (PgdA/CDA1 family)